MHFGGNGVLVKSLAIKLAFCFIAALLPVLTYTLFVLVPEVHAWGIKLSLWGSLVSAVIVSLLPTQRKIVYLPVSFLLSLIVWSGYYSYVFMPNI